MKLTQKHIKNLGISEKKPCTEALENAKKIFEKLKKANRTDYRAFTISGIASQRIEIVRCNIGM